MKTVFTSILFLIFVIAVSGQVAYWHLDEASGNDVYDASIYQNHGIADPTAEIVPGIIGNGRLVPKFTSKYGVTVPNSTSLNINGINSFTLEAFVKLDGYEQNGLAIIQKVGNYGLGLGSYGSTGKLQLFIWPNETAGFVLQHDTQVPLNQWIHVAGTWDGATAKLYINYQVVESQSYSTPIGGSTNPLWLAATGLDIQPTYNTTIDEIRISATALDPSVFLTNMSDIDVNKKMDYFLSQNFPNPFNPNTKIRVTIPKSNLITLKVFDLLGNEISTLINEERQAGSFEVEFDASNLASGIYLYRLQSGNNITVRKMVYLK